MQAAGLYEQEAKPSEVARRLRVSVKSAYHWHQLWRDGGREALASRGPGGSRGRLWPRCLEKLAGYLDEGPAAHGWVEDQVWTASWVAMLIGRKFHVSCSVSGATRLMQAPCRDLSGRGNVCQGSGMTEWPKKSASVSAASMFSRSSFRSRPMRFSNFLTR